VSSKSLANMSRPVVYDFGSAHEFLRAMFEFQKATSQFSIRQRTQQLKNCSPALVSQVLSGQRRLTRDQLPTFAKLFKLNQLEFDYLDKNMRTDLWTAKDTPEVTPKAKREPKNHILSSWLHSYVKDLVNLKGFSLESQTLHNMLFGLAKPSQIQKSIDFLTREGFWRVTPDKKILPEDAAVLSSTGIANEKIREFHKQALKIAQRGIEAFPVERRKASTILLSVDKDKVPELRTLLNSFENQLLDFIEKNPAGKDELLQIAIHMTPVGGKNEI
jgi:uncharacterized protein (TIGR02147 family)